MFTKQKTQKMHQICRRDAIDNTIVDVNQHLAIINDRISTAVLISGPVMCASLQIYTYTDVYHHPDILTRRHD